MASQPIKREREESSSPDEGPMLPLRKQRKGNDDAAAGPATGPAGVNSAIPTNLMPIRFQEYIRNMSNELLSVAKEDGKILDDIRIGEDCLPTWPNRSWDPENDNFHATVQKRLVAILVSEEIGDLVLNEIITKGNEKLEELRRLQIPLAKIHFASNLLPDVLEENDGAASNYEDDSLSNISDFFKDAIFPDDDSISMANSVQPEPLYDEPSPLPDANVLHDAQLLGAGDAEDVDLEVFVAENDDDIAQLPPVELAIDRDAFEYYHGFDFDNAVDVEVPGVPIRCSDVIVLSSDTEDEDDTSNASSKTLAHEIRSEVSEEDESEDNRA